MRTNTSSFFRLLAPMLMGSVAFPSTIVFTDGFEAAGFDPFWTVSQSFGTVSVSNGSAHTGSQSARFSSTSGGQRELLLTHDFANLVQGGFSVYFNDTAPLQETLYFRMVLLNTITGDSAYVGVADHEAFCYMASTGGLGPGAVCGPFSNSASTGVARTSGWHQFGISSNASTVVLSIDGAAVFTLNQGLAFNRLYMHMFGPPGRPNATFYVDDFSMTASEIPEPATTGLAGVALVALAAGFRARPPRG